MTFEQIGGVKESNRMDIAVLMRRAALAYKDARYEEVLAKLPAEEVQAKSDADSVEEVASSQ